VNQVRVGQVVLNFWWTKWEWASFSEFLVDEVRMEEALRDL
jgi:hypothetical protein